MNDLAGSVRVYPVRRWVRVLASLCAALGWVVGVGGLIALRADGELWWGAAALFAGFVVVFGTALPVALWRLRLVVTDGRIEVGAVRMRGLDRDDIAGVWTRETPSGHLVRLVPRDSSPHRKVEFVAQLHDVDDWFIEWLDSLPRGGDPPSGWPSG